MEPELKMNGNTAETNAMPLEGGGGTVCPDSICALRTAQHSTAQHSYNTVLLAVCSKDCCRPRAVAKHGTSAIQASAWCASGSRVLPQCRRQLASSTPHETSFLTPPAPIFPAPGGDLLEFAASLGALRASESSLRRAQILA